MMKDIPLSERYRVECERHGLRPNVGVIAAIKRAISNGTWTLDLQPTYIGARGLLPIVPVVENAQQLSCLKLPLCGAKGEPLLALIQAIRDHPRLHSLDFTGNPIGTEEAEHLLTLVRHNPRVTELVLENTDIVDILKRKIGIQLKANRAKASQMALPETGSPAVAFLTSCTQQATPALQFLSSSAPNLDALHCLFSAAYSLLDTPALQLLSTSTRSVISTEYQTSNTNDNNNTTTNEPMSGSSGGSSAQVEDDEQPSYPLPMWVNVIAHQVSEVLYEHRYNVKQLLCVFDDPPPLDPEECTTEVSPTIPVQEFIRGLSTLGVQFDCLLTANDSDEIEQQMSDDLVQTIEGLGFSISDLFKNEQSVKEGLRSTAPKIIRIAGRVGKQVRKLTRDEVEQTKQERTAYLLDLFGQLTTDGKALYQDFFSLFRTHAYISHEAVSSLATNNKIPYTNSSGSIDLATPSLATESDDPKLMTPLPSSTELLVQVLGGGAATSSDKESSAPNTPTTRSDIMRLLPAPPPPITVSANEQIVVDAIFDSQIELEQGFTGIDWEMSGQVSREEFIVGLASMRCIGPSGALKMQDKESAAADILMKLSTLNGEKVSYNMFFEHFYINPQSKPPVRWFCTRSDADTWIATLKAG